MKSGKLVLGILAAVAVGVVAGILIAPEKGSKKRKRLLREGKDYVDGAKDKFDEMVTAIAKKIETTTNEAGESIDNGKEKDPHARQEIKNTVV